LKQKISFKKEVNLNIKSNEDSKRIFGLDIFRAFAIILVVLSHGSFLLHNTFLEGFPYIKMIDGVDLFFVLSGFLIGGILIKEINSTATFNFNHLLNFWKRRWFRTLPNYYLILLLNYIFVSTKVIHQDIQQFNWKFIFFLQNFNKPFYDFFWESWSLSVEEWFYLTAPILLLLFLRVLNPKKAFISVTILMILFPIAYRIYLLNPEIDSFWFDVTFRKVVITRLDSIAFGLLAAWVFYYYKIYWLKFKVISFILGIAMIAFIVNFNRECNTFYLQVIYFTLTPISAMLLLPFANSIKNVNGIVAKSICHISKISYSMYLINLALIAEVIKDNFPVKNAMDGIIKYGIYWMIVIVGSTFLYNLYEKPIMNLRDRY